MHIKTITVILQVIVPCKSTGSRTYNVHTPSRKKGIKRLTRKSYHSMASTLVNSPTTSKSVISQMATKIKSEMKSLSSDAYDSILRDTIEAVKHFSWEMVSVEFTRKIPTLMSLLSQIIPHASERKPLVCFVASQLLKSRHQQLSLVQRAVSVMMYGNGAAKQVRDQIQQRVLLHYYYYHFSYLPTFSP